MGSKNRGFSDCFYRQKVAERIYQHLLITPEPSAERIARALNSHSASVGRALAWLKERGLVTRSTAEGLYLAEAKTPAELEALAAARDTLGKTEARERGHRAEREKRNNVLLSRERAKWLERYHLGAKGEGD